MRPRALPLALAALACHSETPAPELAPVVAQAIERLEREVASSADAASPAVPEDLEERCAGLLEAVASSRDALRSIALEELALLGEPAVPVLAATLGARETAPAARGAAAEALGRIGSPAAAEALVAVLESSRGAEEPEPWLYELCAGELGRAGVDAIVPRLVLCLKYETDHEAAVVIADALARLGNLSGLDALSVIVRDGVSETARLRATGVLERLRLELGCADPAELERAWRQGDAAHLPPPPRSARYRLAVWRLIAALDEWQLRGVDDARFVLSRLGPDDARALAEALRDRSVYVRVHAAQCLERMGPRAAPAGPQLVAALDDPALAPQAATALGALEFAPAAEGLRARLDPKYAPDLRLAAARALGRLAPLGLEQDLKGLLAADEPAELQAAAAESIVAAARGDVAPSALAVPLRLLARALTSGELEPRGPEAALEAWIARRAEVGDAQDAATLQDWRAVSAEPEAARLAARAELLREPLAALGP